MPLSRKYSFPSKQIEKLYKACETYIQRPMQWDKWIAERWLLMGGVLVGGVREAAKSLPRRFIQFHFQFLNGNSLLLLAINII